MIIESLIDTITAAALAVKISPALLLAICYQESAFRNVTIPDGKSVSTGICMIKTATARHMAELGRIDYTYPSSLMDPEYNVKVAAAYLAYQIERYHGNIWCAAEAYNKGSAEICSAQLDIKRDIRYTKYVSRIRHHLKYQPWVKMKVKEWSNLTL